MREYSKEAWDIASRYSNVLASETRDLAAAIDAAIEAVRLASVPASDVYRDALRDLVNACTRYEEDPGETLPTAIYIGAKQKAEKLLSAPLAEIQPAKPAYSADMILRSYETDLRRVMGNGNYADLEAAVLRSPAASAEEAPEGWEPAGYRHDRKSNSLQRIRSSAASRHSPAESTGPAPEMVYALVSAQAALSDGAFTGPMVDDALNKIAIALHNYRRSQPDTANKSEPRG